MLGCFVKLYCVRVLSVYQKGMKKIFSFRFYSGLFYLVVFLIVKMNLFWKFVFFFYFSENIIQFYISIFIKLLTVLENVFIFIFYGRILFFIKITYSFFISLQVEQFDISEDFLWRRFFVFFLSFFEKGYFVFCYMYKGACIYIFICF